jgi:hypothetical protein
MRSCDMHVLPQFNFRQAGHAKPFQNSSGLLARQVSLRAEPGFEQRRVVANYTQSANPAGLGLRVNRPNSAIADPGCGCGLWSLNPKGLEPALGFVLSLNAEKPDQPQAHAEAVPIAGPSISSRAATLAHSCPAGVCRRPAASSTLKRRKSNGLSPPIPLSEIRRGRSRDGESRRGGAPRRTVRFGGVRSSRCTLGGRVGLGCRPVRLQMLGDSREAFVNGGSGSVAV